MVEAFTNYTRGHGLRDWVLQRVTAVVMAVYVVFLFAFLLAHPHLQFVDWKTLFSYRLMRIATLLVMLNVVVHTWIGLWAVFADYVKRSWVRLLLQNAALLLLLGYLVWLIDILFALER